MDEIEILEEEHDPFGEQILDKYESLLAQKIFHNKWEMDVYGDGVLTYIIDDVSWWRKLLYRIFYGTKFRKL